MWSGVRRLHRFHPALRKGASPPEPVPTRLEVVALAAMCERPLLDPHVTKEAAIELARTEPCDVVRMGDIEGCAPGVGAAWTPTASESIAESVDPLAQAASGGPPGAVLDVAAPT